MKIALNKKNRSLLTEETEVLWGYKIPSHKKTFISSEPYKGFRDMEQEKDPFTPGSKDKPRGLWYACGDDWVSWLRYSGMASWVDDAHYLYEIIPGDDILKISSGLGLRWLVKNFQDQNYSGWRKLNWKKLQDAGYTGIEICPYSKEWEFQEIDGKNRMIPGLWFGDWDVASGCIWDKRGIKDIKLLKARGEFPDEADD